MQANFLLYFDFISSRPPPSTY